MVISILTELKQCIFPSLIIPEWVLDAWYDSLHLVPFLFFAFLVIEFIEFYHADKINDLLNKHNKHSLVAGSIAALIPQCGFSVMAASLYSKRFITRGTLIAVFLVTSDETLPILFAIPEKTYLIIPILLIKIIIGLLAGFLTDSIIPVKSVIQSDNLSKSMQEEGCCKHDIEHGTKRELIIHPLIHTFNVFCFIFIITLLINFCICNVSDINISGHELIQPIIASFIGLIPNCAVSIAFTMMLVKGAISFGSAMSGLLSNAGLGLLVLLKNNDFKDTLKIILILVSVSIIAGLLINFILHALPL